MLDERSLADFESSPLDLLLDSPSGLFSHSGGGSGK